MNICGIKIGDSLQVGCEFTNCVGTDNQSLLPVETYHALVFHGNSLGSGFKVG